MPYHHHVDVAPSDVLQKPVVLGAWLAGVGAHVVVGIHADHCVAEPCRLQSAVLDLALDAESRSLTVLTDPCVDRRPRHPKILDLYSTSRTPTGSPCRPARQGSRALARSRCATWSRRRCGCGPRGSIVGEVRAEECLDLLLALNSGLPGMATVHANSARETLVKLCTLPLLAGENISARFVVPTVAACVDIVVHLGFDAHGRRRVREIVGVPGRVEADIIETEAIFRLNDGQLTRASGMPPRLDRFAACGIDIHALSGSAGTSDDAETVAADGRRSRADGRRRPAY